MNWGEQWFACDLSEFPKMGMGCTRSVATCCKLRLKPLALACLQRLCHVHNAEAAAHGPFRGTGLGANNSVTGASVIRDEFRAEVAGGERHLRTALLSGEFFRVLAQGASNAAALQRGMHGEHPEIS